MPSAFATLESRLNTAALAKLGNASATLADVAVDGIFDNGFSATSAGMGMATTNPSFTLATSLVPASPRGKTLVVGAQTYVVQEHEPDGTGISVLILERAA